MDKLRSVMAKMLTDREIIVYLLVESGMTTRDLAERLGVSHETIRSLHKDAKAKLELYKKTGIL
jgi:DNA-binding CsgD family transcriptional regulator